MCYYLQINLHCGANLTDPFFQGSQFGPAYFSASESGSNSVKARSRSLHKLIKPASSTVEKWVKCMSVHKRGNKLASKAYEIRSHHSQSGTLRSKLRSHVA